MIFVLGSVRAKLHVRLRHYSVTEQITWHSTIGIDRLIRGLLKISHLDYMSLVREIKLLKDDHNFGGIWRTLYDTMLAAGRAQDRRRIGILTVPVKGQGLHFEMLGLFVNSKLLLEDISVTGVERAHASREIEALINSMYRSYAA